MLSPLSPKAQRVFNLSLSLSLSLSFFLFPVEAIRQRQISRFGIGLERPTSLPAKPIHTNV